MTSKRLDMLLKMTARADADSFAWYALALEYKGLGRVDDALAAFGTLRAKDASYVPMYLMCGTMLVEANRRAEAKEWLEAGLVAAKNKGDSHAAEILFAYFPEHRFVFGAGEMDELERPLRFLQFDQGRRGVHARERQIRASAQVHEEARMLRFGRDGGSVADGPLPRVSEGVAERHDAVATRVGRTAQSGHQVMGEKRTQQPFRFVRLFDARAGRDQDRSLPGELERHVDHERGRGVQALGAGPASAAA